MLRITISKSAAGAKKYYCEAYYKEGQSTRLDYYGEGDYRIGTWGGEAARILGLTGPIAQSDFAKLCDNRHPKASRSLTQRHDKDRTVGYDFTFNASKSVSLAYALGNADDKKQVLDAFQLAVRETMQEIEHGMQARVRAKGKNENRLTGNIAYGAFTHFTTRPIDGVPDPHLHSHCFVFNATYDGVDKKWKAGQFRPLKQDAPYYEAVFYSKLAQHLQSAGYGILQTKNGFELAGIHPGTIQKFSRRTKEIETYAREHGITDESGKAAIGARTREAKRQGLASDMIEAQWQDRLMLQERLALSALRRSGSLPKEEERQQAGKEALAFSLHHHLERKSVVSDKELLATAIRSGIGKTNPEAVQAAYKAEHRILSVQEQLRTFVTTKEALQEEKELIRHCTSLRNTFRPINEAYAPQNLHLNDQQRAAVKHALSSTDGITLITGKAGTGKTTLMKEVQHGIQQSGKQIFAFAPSSEASRGVQRSEGFDTADTVAWLIRNQELHPRLKQQVIWIDEAGMLSNKEMNAVLAIANEQSARIILSGDTKQHTSVNRGDALRLIQQETGIQPVTVSKIQRQKGAAYREAVHLLSEGKVEKAFARLDRMEAIREITDSAGRIDAVAEDYCRSTYDADGQAIRKTLVVAPTHAEGDAVTASIRQKLKERNWLGGEERQFTTWKNKQLTEAERQQAVNYEPGNRVMFHQNAKGIKAGKHLEVWQTDEASVTVRDATGKPHALNLSEAQKFQVFEPRNLELAKGDRIRMTANSKSMDGKNLFNGTAYNITGFDKAGNPQLSNGSTLSGDAGHFHYGYVSTSHASQGKTADKVILSQSAATFRAASMEQFYVSVSRGKTGVAIYTDDKEQLLDAVCESSRRTAATELIAKREEQARQVERVSRFQQWREKTVAVYDHLKTRFNHDGLQTTARTEQDAACR